VRSEGQVRCWVDIQWALQRYWESMGRHMSEQDQTAHTQTDFRGQPEWATDGAQAGLCAPARIAVVLFEIVKHGCW